MLSPSVRSRGAIVALSAGGVDSFFDLLERGCRTGDEDDVGARGRQRLRSRGADAAAGAGDNRELA